MLKTIRAALRATFSSLAAFLALNTACPSSFASPDDVTKQMADDPAKFGDQRDRGARVIQAQTLGSIVGFVYPVID